ncbi:MAG TPA: AraC family transcriptional regulator [Pyrinomonadaceae bacterium]|nr:AraC family transcriptional regulator [Pyrinomonadaceae bacterium]
MGSLAIIKSQTPVVAYHAAQWNGLRLGHWRAPAGEVLERTRPDHEINIPISGNFTSSKHTASGSCRSDRANARNICIVPAGQPIAVRWREEVEGVTLSLSPSLLACAASGDDSRTQIEIVETYEAEDHLIRQIGLALLAEALTSEPVGRLYAESLTQTLALHLVRHYSVSRRAPEMFRGGLSGYNLRRAQDFINEHLEQNLTLAGIAESVGLSQFHFARAFKLTTNITPQQYLTERRVERAKHLLSESDLPLVEVGARAGFKSQSHFTTLFRRFTGTTPKAWRQSRLS